MASEQFSLCWDNFHKNMSSGMNSLLESEDLVDVTLAVEGKFLKAHKMVLSVCSPYFKDLFKSMNPYQHPVVFMKDVSYVAISDLLQFMYQGEVQVSQENLTTFIKTAEALQIKGLTGDGNGSLEGENDLPTRNSTTSEPQITQMPRPKVQRPAPAPVVSSTPVTKKPRLSQSSEPAATLVPTKQEPVAPVQQEAAAPPVHFKMEPYDQNQSVTIPDDDEQDTEQGFDDTHDDTEDYSMMEGDEPQAGTSTDGAGEGQGPPKPVGPFTVLTSPNPEVQAILRTAKQVKTLFWDKYIPPRTVWIDMYKFVLKKKVSSTEVKIYSCEYLKTFKEGKRVVGTAKCTVEMIQVKDVIKFIGGEHGHDPPKCNTKKHSSRPYRLLGKEQFNRVCQILGLKMPRF